MARKPFKSGKVVVGSVTTLLFIQNGLEAETCCSLPFQILQLLEGRDISYIDNTSFYVAIVYRI